MLRHRQQLRGQRGDLLLRPAGIFGSVDEPDEVAAGHVRVLRRIGSVREAAKEAWGRLLYRCIVGQPREVVGSAPECASGDRMWRT